jgi:hypothetical protein
VESQGIEPCPADWKSDNVQENGFFKQVISERRFTVLPLHQLPIKSIVGQVVILEHDIEVI